MASVRDQAIGAAIGVIVAGVLGVVGNAATNGALVGYLAGATKEEVKKLDERVTALEEAPAPVPIVPPIPSGAVMAFDLASGCPDGWTEFTDAAGRTVIGQGRGTLDENNPALTSRKYREHGGQEKVALDLAHMPEHQHDLKHLGTARGNGNGTVNWRSGDNPKTIENGTGPAGEGEPHDNMSPFIALYYCKKN